MRHLYHKLSLLHPTITTFSPPHRTHSSFPAVDDTPNLNWSPVRFRCARGLLLFFYYIPGTPSPQPGASPGGCAHTPPTRRGAEEACWAHNPEVIGSKPIDACRRVSRHPSRVSQIKPAAGCEPRQMPPTPDHLSERLRRWTRNPLGYARVGSSPAVVAASSRVPPQARSRVRAPADARTHARMHLWPSGLRRWF